MSRRRWSVLVWGRRCSIAVARRTRQVARRTRQALVARGAWAVPVFHSGSETPVSSRAWQALVSGRDRSCLARRSLASFGMLSVAGVVSLCGLPASAAASPTTPPSTVSCSGTIRPDAGGSAAGNANPFDYKFSCGAAIVGASDPSGYTWDFSGNIWSYAIVVTRRNDNGNNVTYEAPTATVLTSSGEPDGTQYVNCSSFVPSDGFGCTAPGPAASSTTDLANGTSPAYLQYIPAGDTVTGAFALTEGYCSFLPKGAKPGTPAVPQATVELIVTDTNGVTEGPFQLTRSTRCPKVPKTVPEPKRKHHAKKTSRSAAKTDSKQRQARHDHRA